MKPVSIKGYRKKEVRKLFKEKRRLCQESWDLGYRKLDKPIRHGWYKEMALTPQLERYKCKPEIEEIAQKFSITIWGRTKEEAEKKWNDCRSKHLIYNGIPTLSPKSYRKLSEKAQRYCTVFFFKCEKKWRRRYYVRIPKLAYKIKFSRAYVTHSKIIDPAIEERLDLIEQQFLKAGWYEAASIHFSYRCRWQIDKIKKDRKNCRSTLRQYKNASLQEAENELIWERN